MKLPSNEEIMEQNKISLPSDAEIIKNSKHNFNYQDSFYGGATWMKNLAEIEIAKLRTEADNKQKQIDRYFTLFNKIAGLEAEMETIATNACNEIKELENDKTS